MKNLMTKQNLLYVGIGLATAFVVYNVLVNREKASQNSIKGKPLMTTSTADESSDFCGCGA